MAHDLPLYRLAPRPSTQPSIPRTTPPTQQKKLQPPAPATPRNGGRRKHPNPTILPSAIEVVMNLFFFIDALGWEVLKRHPDFLADLAPHRKPLTTIFGYSSACDPAIISGKLPSENKHWSSYYYSPDTSPFKDLWWLNLLPRFLSNRHRIRSRLSRLVRHRLGYTGYFELYLIPFRYLRYFDYVEKKRIYEPGGLVEGETIFDIATQQGIPYHVSGPLLSDEEKLKRLKHDLEHKKIEFAYVTLGKLDATMHAHGNAGAPVDTLLTWYDQQIRAAVGLAKTKYNNVSVHVFSDHGMHNVTKTFDLQKEIQKLPLQYGIDYVAMYDSTMARFWFLNNGARHSIAELLQQLNIGSILTEGQLKKWGVYFPDQKFGEIIFQMQSGSIIAPSFVNDKWLPGMHGYPPEDPDSYATLASSDDIPANIQGIQDIFQLLKSSLERKP